MSSINHSTIGPVGGAGLREFYAIASLHVEAVTSILLMNTVVPQDGHHVNGVDGGSPVGGGGGDRSKSGFGRGVLGGGDDQGGHTNQDYLRYRVGIELLSKVVMMKKTAFKKYMNEKFEERHICFCCVARQLKEGLEFLKNTVFLGFCHELEEKLSSNSIF